jgi:hypothetical protein
MRFFWRWPWVATVLAVPTLANAQVTVNDEATPASVVARPRTTITLSSGAPGTTAHRGSAGFVPEFHTVSSGDTLWDITGYYFENPWYWPRVWARNPQITNPHWIFPNDQVRLLLPNEVSSLTPATSMVQTPNGLRVTRSNARYPRGTVFMRESAWATTEDIAVSGSIVGAPEDNMLLAEGDQAYVEFPRRAPNVGETYTIYNAAQETSGSDHDAGHVVRVLGTAVVDAWDARRHIATVRITESLDPIERGERVAVLQRQFLPVPPVPNDRDLTGHVVATPTPREIVGSNFVVIIDRGAQEGVRLGNRLFLTQRGDPWRRSVEGYSRGIRIQEIDRDGDGNVDHAPDAESYRAGSELPVEVAGELIVVAVHPHSAACLVSLSSREVEIGAPVVMRRGY